MVRQGLEPLIGFQAPSTLRWNLTSALSVGLKPALRWSLTVGDEAVAVARRWRLASVVRVAVRRTWKVLSATLIGMLTAGTTW